MRSDALTRAVIFWQDMPSIHQSALVRSLAERKDYNVTLVTCLELTASRVGLGWHEPDFGQARWVHLPSEEAVAALVGENDGPDCVHLFFGMHGYQLVYRAFKKVMKTRARIGVMAEAPDGRGLKGRLRRVRYGLQARRFRKRIEFFLAMGRLGVRWYVRSGFPADRVFEFGYFVEEAPVGAGSSSDADVFRIVFIGQLIPRKGVDTLLEALARMTKHRWTLHVIGDGVMRSDLESRAIRVGIADRVTWAGAVPNALIHQHLRNHDLLVLPSRHDGWGGVVNEALLNGIPVVCSDACGAASLIVSNRQGEVTQANDSGALRAAIEKRFLLGRPTSADRDSLKAWARCATGPSGAEYLREVLDCVLVGSARPRPPWQV
jgi:glycosyltransferase involved in cell wall biosynthesis